MNLLSIRPTITKRVTIDGKIQVKGEKVMPDGKRLFCYSFIFDTDAKADAFIAKRGGKV